MLNETVYIGDKFSSKTWYVLGNKDLQSPLFTNIYYILLQQQVETVLPGDPHMNLITLPAFSGIYDFCFLIQIEPNTKKPDILPIPSEISRENAGAKVFCGKTFFN